jgi:hypothetical protein
MGEKQTLNQRVLRTGIGAERRAAFQDETCRSSENPGRALTHFYTSEPGLFDFQLFCLFCKETTEDVTSKGKSKG